MPTNQETRLTDPTTGGQKGIKLQRFDLIPVEPLKRLAEVFGFGAKKYEDRNWEKGYPWGWSYGALQRHLAAFWGGEDIDPESGLPHLAHAMWHCTVLMEFSRLGVGTDDRSKFNYMPECPRV